MEQGFGGEEPVKHWTVADRRATRRGPRYARNPRRSVAPPRLVIGGRLCCLACRRPYADHELREACFRRVVS